MSTGSFPAGCTSPKSTRARDSIEIAVVEYVAATGDDAILDVRTPYLEAEQPFEPLPAAKHGMGFDPLRSAREDTVYRHCLKAIDLVL